MGKMMKNVSKMVNNKYFLYFVATLSLLSIVGYSLLENYKAVLLFVLIAYLITHFSKNMVHVLIVPLILVNLFVVLSNYLGLKVREGLDNATTTSAPVTTTSAPTPTPILDASGMPITTSAPVTTTSAPTPTPILDTSGGMPITTSAPVAATTTTTPVATTPPPKEQFTGRLPLTPANFDGSKSKETRVDYGTTLEKAYDDLNGVLGGDGIKQLTKDTQTLMQQQLQLANAMKEMTPLLGQAKDMLKSLDIKELGDINDIVKNLGIQPVASTAANAPVSTPAKK